MSQQHMETVKRLFDAVRRRDQASLLALVCGLGNFLDLKQTDYVFLDTVNSGVISHQKMSKDAVFPESTK